MTDQITVPRATWDAMREALKHGVLEMNLSGKTKECMPLHHALTAANAVSDLSLANEGDMPQAHGEAIHQVYMGDGWKDKPASEMWMYTPEQGWESKYVRTVYTHPQATEPAQRCWCETCRLVTLGDMRMIVCPECGNKRCPKATHHDNACTNSNDIGQKGSSWEHAKKAAPEAKQ